MNSLLNLLHDDFSTKLNHLFVKENNKTIPTYACTLMSVQYV